MLQPLAFVILLALWCDSASAAHLSAGESCITPGGNHGRCMLVKQCLFVQQLHRNAGSRKDHQYVMSFKCGQEVGTKKILVCCPELRSAEPCGQLTMYDRIVGGEETELDEFLWAVALAYTNGKVSKFQCGGSLINDRYVLTAAHCFRSNSKWQLDFVRVGEWDMDTNPDCKLDPYNDRICNKPHQDFGVTKVIIHEGYSNNDRSKTNDIAILKLDGQVPKHSHVPICIPTQTMLDNLNIEQTRFDVTGWGLTEERISSKRKLKVEVPGQPISACSKAFKVNDSFFSDSQLCVGGEKGKDSCKGDSGGPLMVVQENRWHLVGIVSYGSVYCGSKDVPAIYTRVGSYLDWVAGKLELESREA